ncbi:hypothetical protein IMZ31_24035 (plasmid) [Pontibacillus sp. ALD_SL1]|uniref:hypothetical protein n=1 Tax=Pontibacillus sp. ALD_SL1 TaxID=2777185 RepID=UPI001A96D3E5|nr:hypothetical protein [Pontibacillus sp. ALD_SL1]QST02523.1 hypothetical protein IMZ31_24035 [Pontibacillus sp. ALD_SL1]
MNKVAAFLTSSAVKDRRLFGLLFLMILIHIMNQNEEVTAILSGGIGGLFAYQAFNKYLKKLANDRLSHMMNQPLDSLDGFAETVEKELKLFRRKSLLVFLVLTTVLLPLPLLLAFSKQWFQSDLRLSIFFAGILVAFHWIDQGARREVRRAKVIKQEIENL